MKRRAVPLGVPTPLRLAILLSLLSLLPSPSSALHEFKEWRELGAVEWGAAENPEIGINHSVILFDGHIVDDSDRAVRSSYSRYRSVRVFDATGADEFRTVQIPYRKGWKISRIKARTVKPSGEIIAVGEDDIHEKTIFSIGKNRLRAKVFAFKGVEPGDIVEFMYTARSDDLAPPLVQIQGRAYTLEASLRWYYYPQPYAEDFVNATSDLLDVLTYRSAYVVPNGRAYGGKVTPFGNESSPEGIDVVFQNLPALPDEPYMPADRAMAVIFAAHYEWPRREAKQPYWSRIAEGFGSSTRDFLERQESLGPWMGEILDRPRSLDEDLAACVEKVHKEIRNVDLLDDDEMPERVPESETIDELLENRMGDGKQIDYLVTAMLKKLGYQATVFWARDHEEGPFIPEWKSAEQFTMCGVAIRRDANRIHFCVPHLTAAAPTTLPWEISGAKALMEDLSDDRTFSDFPPLCDIPMAAEEGNSAKLEVVLREADEGKLAGRLTARWECRSEPFFLQSVSNTLRKSRKDALAMLKGRALRSGIEWSAFEESLSVGTEAVAYSCSLQVDGMVEQAGAMSLVDLGALRIDDYAISEEPTEVRSGLPPSPALRQPCRSDPSARQRGIGPGPSRAVRRPARRSFAPVPHGRRAGSLSAAS